MACPLSRFFSLLPISAVLLGAGPVETEDWTTLRAGAASAGQGMVVLSHSRQDPRGYTLQLAGTGVFGAPRTGTFALRMGYHGGYGGVELGAGAWRDSDGLDSRASVCAWAGLPAVHAWIDTWPAEESGAVTTALSGAGLGSQWARARGSLGVWATAGEGVPISARVAARTGDAVWVGAAGWVAASDVRVMLTISLSRAARLAQASPSLP